MTRLAVIAILLLAAPGCVGGNYKIAAPKFAQPVSATGAVYNERGEVCRVPEQLEIVDHFTHKVRHWSIMWTMVDLSPDSHDVSSLLASSLQSGKGDAIINFEVTTSNTGVLNVFGLVPLLPTMTTSTIEGDVVRLKRQ